MTKTQNTVASDDVAHARANTPALVDVLANDTDTEGGIVAYSLSVVVPAASGTARAVMEPGPRLEYRPASAGIDVLVYRVCDRHRRCDTAELVTFTRSARR